MSIFDDHSPFEAWDRNPFESTFDRLFGRPRDGLLNPHKFTFDDSGNVLANGASTGTRIDKDGDIRDEFGRHTGYIARHTGLPSWCRDIVPLRDPFKP